ncbi:MAG: hypothetical protein NC124_07550 [Clostridium sp.]|nr:hypothetical protein [Clostridium sp.]
MKNRVKGIYYQLKGISHFVWIPFLVLYILLPAVHYAVYLPEKDMDAVYRNILNNAQYIIPLFSIWHILFVLYHLIEQPGSELLYVTETCKLQSIVLLYLLYMILMLPLFAGYTYFFPEFWWLYAKLSIVNLMYAMFVYAAGYVFRRIIPGILVALFYTSIGFWGDTKGLGMISYYSYELQTGRELFRQMVPVIMITVVFIIVGLLANNRFFYHHSTRSP